MNDCVNVWKHGTINTLKNHRDKSRYQNKGLQETSVKTLVGTVVFKRHEYIDRTAVESSRTVYLLDQELGIEKIGQMSASLCQLAAEAVCLSSYRGAAEIITEATGLSMSTMGVWNIIQQLGLRGEEQVEHHAELAEVGKGVGVLESKILYEENDGVWLNLQGASRQEHGEAKEMKMGIAYDGVQWERTASGTRRTLDNKIAYATFNPAKDFFRCKEGLIASRFNIKHIERRVLNGDGAQWIQNHVGEKCIRVLDAYHRNRKIGRCVKDKEKAKERYALLYAGKIPELLARIEEMAQSVTEVAEAERLYELLRYYTENKDALLGYYDRGVDIPETRDPGTIHHARLGSMESNVFTLIGNRMKGRRACWSVNGANHLALLLCQKHTTGFEWLFAELPHLPLPENEDEEWKTAPILPAGKIPERTGHGYDFYANIHIANVANWLQGLVNRLP